MKPESEFHNRKGKFYKSSWCKECLKAYLRERWERAIKYLGGKCSCGCDIIDVLEIHHRNGDGGEERKTCKGVVFYNKILRMPVDEAKKEYAVDCLACHGADHVILKHPEIKYEIKFIKG